MSRKPHPYFGQLNRLEQVAAPSEGCGRSPPMTPDEQQGVLWQALREASEPA